MRGAIAIVAAIVFVRPLFQVPWWVSHERIGYVARYVEFVSGYEGGLAYPRWCPDFAAGKGYPLFEFYPPGFFFTALGVHLATGAGPLMTLKLALVLLTILGGLAMGWLALQLTGGDSLAATVAAIAFVFSPYHCVDLYARGDLAEYAAIQFLPMVFLGLERLAARAWRGESVAGAAAILAVAFAATSLSHPIAGLFAGYVGGIYLLIRTRKLPTKSLLTVLVWAATAFIIGSALTAFWSYTVMMNEPHVQLWHAVTERYNIARIWPLPFGTKVVAPGLVFALAILIAFVRVGPRRLLPSRLLAFAERLLPATDRLDRLRLWMWLTLILIPLTWKAVGFLPVWHLPLVHFAQFPWRLLMVVSVGGAAIIALLIHHVPRERVGWRWAAASAFAVLAVGAVWSCVRVREPIGLEEIPLTREAIVQAKTTYTAGEYLPKGAPLEESLEAPPAQPARVIKGQADVSVVSSGYANYEFAIDARGEAVLEVSQFLYEGWKAERLGPDSGPLELRAGQRGLITLDLPPGRYNILVQWRPTATHLKGRQISMMGLLGLVLFGLLGFVKRTEDRRRRRLGLPGPISVPIEVTRRPFGALGIRPRDFLFCLVIGCLAFFAVEIFNNYEAVANALKMLKTVRSSEAASAFPKTAFIWRGVKYLYFYLFAGAAVGALLCLLAQLLIRPVGKSQTTSRKRFWWTFIILLAAFLVYIHLRMLTLHPALFDNSYRWAWFAGNPDWVLIVWLIGKVVPILIALYLLRKYLHQVGSALKRFRWVVAIGLVVIIVGAGSWWVPTRWRAKPAPSANKGPNVILIALDSLRPDHLSWKGLPQPYPKPTTPNIDRFLGDAVWFDKVFVPIARTYPSWISLLTGCWPPTDGVRFDLPPRNRVFPRVPTFAQALQKAGYKTAFFLDNTNFAWMQPEVGFDEIVQPIHNAVDFYISSAQLPTILYFFFLNNPLGFYYDPGLRINAAYRATDRPEFMNREIARFLRRMRSEPKFFQAIHLCSIHVPFCVSYPYSTMFAPKFGPVPNRFGYRPLLEQILLRKETKQRFSAEESAWIFTQEMNLYDALVRSSDDNFGATIDAVKKAGLYDNSYIILTADHGENLPEPGLRYIYGSSTHGFFLWGDGDTHVPLAIKFPDRRYAGRRVEGLTRSIDLAPTLLESLGLPPLDKAEGVSRLPDIEGKPDDRDRWAYAETGLSASIFFIRQHLDYEFAGYPEAHEIDGDTLDVYKKERYMPNLVAVKDRMIRTERWKMISYPTVTDKLSFKTELFDMQTDRNCCNDVSTSYPAVRRELFERLWPFIQGDLKEFGPGELNAVPQGGRMLRESER